MKTKFIISLIFFTISIFIATLILVVKFPSLKENAAYYEHIVVSISTILGIPPIFFLFKDYQEKLQKRRKSEQASLEEKEKFLDISINIQNENNCKLIRTQVFNKTNEPQNIKYAILLISKQDCWYDIIHHINIEFGLNIHYTNELVELKGIVETPLWMPEYAGGIIPLTFYYEENIRISNENPSFVYTFDNREIELPSGIYSVRFYIFPENERYHRSTVDSFIIP